MMHLIERLDIEEHPVGAFYKQLCDGYIAYVGESVFSLSLPPPFINSFTLGIEYTRNIEWLVNTTRVYFA